MKNFNADEFDEAIYDDEQKSLVFFHRKGCHVCEELSGLIEELEEEYTDITFAEVDVEEENELFSRFGLKGVPQVILFSDGTLFKTISGRKDDEEYEDALEALSQE